MNIMQIYEVMVYKAIYLPLGKDRGAAGRFYEVRTS